MGDGLPQAISEYNMTFGTTGSFSLQFPENGIQPVNNMAVDEIEALERAIPGISPAIERLHAIRD